MCGTISGKYIKTCAIRLFRQKNHNKNFGFQCQLVFQIIKMTKIKKVMKKDKSLKQVISNITNASDTIKNKSDSKDRNVA